MTSIVASAPGKLIIAGEYAVLQGAPAIAMAVNRRVEVTLRSSDAGCHCVRAPGLVEHPGRFRFEDGDLTWLDGEDGYELIAALWPHFKTNDDSHYDIVIDSQALSDESGKKLGLGSSAAVSVALAGALVAEGSDAIAADAHRAFQGGRGSGVDIACSTTGGVIEFEGGRTRSVAWPDGLAYTIFWSGQPSNTRDKLEKLGEGDSATLRTLYRAAQDVAAAWAGDNSRAVLSALSYYVTILRAFDIDRELGIFDAGHLELTEAADTMDMLYKPCGAGGGDLGLLVSPAGTDTAAFSALAANAGFKAMDLAIDPAGLSVTQAGSA